MDVGRGMAIAANMKVLNDSVQVEINAAKMAILARKEGHEFGKVVQMGTQLLGHDAVLPLAYATPPRAPQQWSMPC